MATHRIPIIGFSSRPDDTSDCFFIIGEAVLPNALARQQLVVFGLADASEPTVKHGFYGSFDVPENFASGATIVARWATDLTTGDVVWDFDYRAIASGESIDPSTWQESVTASGAAAGTAFQRVTTTLALTDANLAPGDDVFYLFSRDGANGTDDLAGRALLTGLYFTYSD